MQRIRHIVNVNGFVNTILELHVLKNGITSTPVVLGKINIERNIPCVYSHGIRVFIANFDTFLVYELVCCLQGLKRFCTSLYVILDLNTESNKYCQENALKLALSIAPVRSLIPSVLIQRVSVHLCSLGCINYFRLYTADTWQTV